MGKLLRDPQAGEGGGERRGGRRSVINTVISSTSKAINGQLSSAGLVLGGVNLKDTEGDDPPSVSTSPPHHRRGAPIEGTRGDRQLALAGDRADADAGRRAVHREPHHNTTEAVT